MSTKDQKNTTVESNERILAIRDIIFGENIKEIDNTFDDVKLKIESNKKEIKKIIEETEAELNQLIDNLDSSLNIRITNLEDKLNSRLEDLDEIKVNKEKLSELFYSLSLKIKE